MSDNYMERLWLQDDLWIMTRRYRCISERMLMSMAITTELIVGRALVMPLNLICLSSFFVFTVRGLQCVNQPRDELFELLLIKISSCRLKVIDWKSCTGANNSFYSIYLIWMHILEAGRAVRVITVPSEKTVLLQVNGSRPNSLR